jgi:hypothetical protein
LRNGRTHPSVGRYNAAALFRSTSSCLVDDDDDGDGDVLIHHPCEESRGSASLNA